jgi:Lon protease-like protein
MPDSIRVNFGKPIGVFPLPGAVLLPHAIQPLHIFEPRYRQLVNECLDGSGQMAVASFAGVDWPRDYEGCPPLRPVVCIGQIVQHLPLPDGRHDILLQGICRARIMQLIEPEDERLYRMARLAPLEPVHENPPPMPRQRRQLRTMLSGPRLSRMRGVDKIMQWFDHKDVPTHALLELIGFSLLHDGELRYRLLAEASPIRRADIISTALANLDHLIRVADRQPYRDWPKGMSWN